MTIDSLPVTPLVVVPAFSKCEFHRLPATTTAERGDLIFGTTGDFGVAVTLAVGGPAAYSLPFHGAATTAGTVGGNAPRNGSTTVVRVTVRPVLDDMAGAA